MLPYDFSLQNSEIGMSCGCLGVLYKPRYKRQVDEIYPRDPLDEKIIATEMDKLKYYTLNHPEKLGRIGDYLLSIVDTGLYKGQDGWVKVSIDAMVELLRPNHDRINLFVSSYLEICSKLLAEKKQKKFRVWGSEAFVQFSKEEEGSVQEQ